MTSGIIILTIVSLLLITAFVQWFIKRHTKDRLDCIFLTLTWLLVATFAPTKHENVVQPASAVIAHDSLYVKSGNVVTKFDKMNDINVLKDSTEVVVRSSYNLWGRILGERVTTQKPKEIQ